MSGGWVRLAEALGPLAPEDYPGAVASDMAGYLVAALASAGALSLGDWADLDREERALLAAVAGQVLARRDRMRAEALAAAAVPAAPAPGPSTRTREVAADGDPTVLAALRGLWS